MIWTIPWKNQGRMKLCLVWLQHHMNLDDVEDIRLIDRRGGVSEQTGKVVLRHLPELSTGPNARS